MRESVVEKTVNRFAKENGIGTFKLSGAHARGKSDRLYFKDSRVIFLELKAPGEKPTPLQFKNIRDIHATGTEATWADNVPDAVRILKTFFNL